MYSRPFAGRQVDATIRPGDAMELGEGKIESVRRDGGVHSEARVARFMRERTVRCGALGQRHTDLHSTRAQLRLHSATPMRKCSAQNAANIQKPRVRALRSSGRTCSGGTFAQTGVGGCWEACVIRPSITLLASAARSLAPPGSKQRKRQIPSFCAYSLCALWRGQDGSLRSASAGRCLVWSPWRVHGPGVRV